VPHGGSAPPHPLRGPVSLRSIRPPGGGSSCQRLRLSAPRALPRCARFAPCVGRLAAPWPPCGGSVRHPVGRVHLARSSLVLPVPWGVSPFVGCVVVVTFVFPDGCVGGAVGDVWLGLCRVPVARWVGWFRTRGSVRLAGLFGLCRRSPLRFRCGSAAYRFGSSKTAHTRAVDSVLRKTPPLRVTKWPGRNTNTAVGHRGAGHGRSARSASGVNRPDRRPATKRNNTLTVSGGDTAGRVGRACEPRGQACRPHSPPGMADTGERKQGEGHGRPRVKRACEPRGPACPSPTHRPRRSGSGSAMGPTRTRPVRSGHYPTQPDAARQDARSPPTGRDSRVAGRGTRPETRRLPHQGGRRTKPTTHQGATRQAASGERQRDHADRRGAPGPTCTG